MNKATLFFISLVSFGIGILLFAIQHEWIVIRFSQNVPIYSAPKIHAQKKINLYYWNTDRWHKESQEILWSSHKDANLEAIISSWLALMDAERITPKKVIVQSALLAPNKADAFVSFDRIPFSKAWSIEKKWMLIEGLLKTIRENGMPITTIQFLLEHLPMTDPHLDFSCPWPINGFR